MVPFKFFNSLTLYYSASPQKFILAKRKGTRPIVNEGRVKISSHCAQKKMGDNTQKWHAENFHEKGMNILKRGYLIIEGGSSNKGGCISFSHYASKVMGRKHMLFTLLDFNPF